MSVHSIKPDQSVSLFVKDILIFENDERDKQTVIPLFADGYPGIMYQETENGLYVTPQNKTMPAFFLYGQTIHPMELRMQGAYKAIVFQLYPFVTESFFGIDPRSLNDDCYDLAALRELDIRPVVGKLFQSAGIEEWSRIISDFLFAVFELKREMLDEKIREAIQIIIRGNGQQSIRELRDALHLGERSFERRFLTQTGVTPKQFCNIIRFQCSLSDLNDKRFEKLSDIVYRNGFADQSHFIRVFKSFTGDTPSGFMMKAQG